VAFHWAKFAAQIEDWDEVYSQAQLAFSYFGMCRAEKNFGRWSDDIKKWMADADTEAERIWDISREHRPYP
jgi:hypothetical protein